MCARACVRVCVCACVCARAPRACVRAKEETRLRSTVVSTSAVADQAPPALMGRGVPAPSWWGHTGLVECAWGGWAQ